MATPRKTAQRKRTAGEPRSGRSGKTAAPTAKKTVSAAKGRAAAAKKTAPAKGRAAAAKKTAAAEGRAAAAKKTAAASRDAAKDRSPGRAGKTFVERRSLSAGRADTLLHLEERLGERIVGKEDAIAAIARVVRISGTNLDFRPERPSGAFLLVGPEGVGKNEIAYAVGEVVHGSDEAVASIDLGEFDDEESLAKLGATLVPGSETHYMPGVLTAPVRENPEAILLLRGLEQAHPAFQRLLLHVLERGRIEDMVGEVSFDKTLIFVTLTLSREELTTHEIGFGRPTKTPEARLREVVSRFVLPDLIDAFHEILELPPLSIPEVRLIAQYKVDKVLRRMAQKKTSIAVSPSVYDELITDDMCRHGGAKFLNRTLEQRLFNPLARYLLENRTSREIRIGMHHGDIVIDTTNPGGPMADRALDGPGSGRGRGK